MQISTLWKGCLPSYCESTRVHVHSAKPRSGIHARRTDEGGLPVKGPDGRLTEVSAFAVSKEDGAPDGMTIDRCAQRVLRV